MNKIMLLIIGCLITSRCFADDIRDIRGPVWFQVNRMPLIVIGVVVIIAAIFFLVKYLVRRNKEGRGKKVSLKRPDEIAYERLSALKSKDLPRQGKVKEFYVDLSDIVRKYLEGRFSLRSLELTTEEFLYEMKNSNDLIVEHKNLLKDFLSHCDMVKFAKYGPAETEMERSYDSAKRLVDETKQDAVGLGSQDINKSVMTQIHK